MLENYVVQHPVIISSDESVSISKKEIAEQMLSSGFIPCYIFEGDKEDLIDKDQLKKGSKIDYIVICIGPKIVKYEC